MIDRRELIKLGALASAGLLGTVDAQETPDIPGDTRLFGAFTTGGGQMPEIQTGATGFTLFVVREDGIDYAFSVADIENLLMAHIHVGGPEESGPVAVWLDPSVDAREPNLREGTTTGITASGTITADDFVGPLEGESLGALLELMEMNQTYVNAHTEQNQGGEIRGQIGPVEELVMPSP